MATWSQVLQVTCSMPRASVSRKLDQFKASFSSSIKPLLRELQQTPIAVDVPKAIREASVRLLDAFVDSMIVFVDQPLLPSQSNFAPVEEIGGVVYVTEIEGWIPEDFPEGVYIRNGSNPLFGGLKSTESIFGKSSHIWVEGEGVLHALYFEKDTSGSWMASYNNRHVQTGTYKLEKQRKKPAFLPGAEGDSLAVLLAYLLNLLRFGEVNKHLSNTNVFEHSGKLYSIAENHMPQEVDILTLKTLGNWDVDGAWDRPFTSHPKKDPDTGELVIMGIDAKKPYMVLGVVSADGKKLVHKVDLKFSRCTFCHEIGISQSYNVILDFPLTIDIKRLIRGGPLIKYNKEEYARLGVMPRYGDADSVRWFEVEPSSVFHIFNCFEEDDEVVVMGCRARGSIIPAPDFELNKFEWFSEGLKHVNSVEENNENSQGALFFTRVCEWRLNMQSGEVKQRDLTNEFSMEFPMINQNFTGVENKYGYAQVVDSFASSTAGMPKYGGLSKLYFQERHLGSPSVKLGGERSDLIKVEYHKFPANTFCSGATFVPKAGSLEEDDGWIITFVHNEDTNISQVYVVDAKKFSSDPVAKITLPSRVPYGFHGAFIPISS